MEAFKYHIYICDQKKPEGVQGCNARGSAKVIDALRKEIAAKGLLDDVRITTCGSLGLCERGPNMVVYPDGTWYSNVTVDDVPEIVQEHFKNGRAVERLVNRDAIALKAEINLNKGKMIAYQAGRDKAGALPDELMLTIQGFRESRVILSAIELDIFNAIGSEATFQQAAAKRKLDPRATEMLLNALVALDLLEKKDGKYLNTPISSRYFLDGSPDGQRKSLMHTVNLWDRWSTMTEATRIGTSVAFKEQRDRDPKDTESFIAAMHSNVKARASIVVNALGADKFSRMLDVGGGSGGYAIEFAKANKHLKAVVFDLPNVVPLTQKYINDAGLEEQISTQPGDMHHDNLGNGFDFVFISAICHMNSPDENRKLFKKSYDALITGGQIVVQDFILEPDKTSPKSAVLFALNMLVGTKEGNTYSEDEYFDWLREESFKKLLRIRLPGPTGLIIGIK